MVPAPLIAAASGSGAAASGTASSSAAAAGGAEWGAAGGPGSTVASDTYMMKNYGLSEQGFAADQAKKSKSAEGLTKSDIRKNQKNDEEQTITLKEISKKFSKTIDRLEKVSPLFKQQMKIIDATLTLLLRPLGDFLARWLRPFTMIGLKVMIYLYPILKKISDFFSPGGNTANDEKKRLEEQLELARQAGDKEREARLQKEYDELVAHMFSFNKLFKSIGDMFSSLWISLGIFAGQVGSFVSTLWNDYIVPGFNGALNWATDLWNTYIVPIGSWFSDLPNKLWDLISGKKTSESIPTSTTKTGGGGGGGGGGSVNIPKTNIVGSSITSPIGSQVRAASSIAYPTVMNQSSGVGVTSPFGRSFASGGNINKTGAYNLHAGETVLNAGQSRNSGGNVSFLNNITINGSINSDMDIRSLARKLAAYQEVELRRRVSY